MFLDFYKLKEQPFGVTPDPHFLYLSGSHREALASLFYGVETGRGLLALVAPPGMGKTTLLFRLLDHLRRSARTAFLFQTQCDSFGLMRYLMGDLGIDTRGQDFVTMHERLNELLVRETNSGRRFVLVIDEAQNLDNSVLETARLLSDFETPSKKLLQIVFAGQPQLAEKLQRPELAQLRQRISILGRLEPFSASEVTHYIHHRLRVAGLSSGSLFTPEASARIAASSKGIPRTINLLCFNALSLGCALGSNQIDADLICAAEADLDLSSVADESWREGLPVALPESATPRESAAAKICHGATAQTLPARVGDGLSGELLTRALDSEIANQSLDVRCMKFVAGDAAGISLVESFEYAQERNAEILAEIVIDGTSGNAYLAPPGNYDDTCRQLEPDTPERLVDIFANQLPVSPTKPFKGNLTGDADRDPTSSLSIFHAPRRDHTIGRLAVVASVIVLALFVGIFDRQDLETATAQTRGAIALAAASFSRLPIARKAEKVVLDATAEQRPKGTGSDLSSHGAVVTKGVSATMNSVAATLASVPLDSARERRVELAFSSRTAAKHRAQFEEGTTAVIVQANDDLRQICLRHLGRYDMEVLHKVTEINPEISDPDRITVGQRIILPQASVRAYGSRFSTVNKP
jgi:general secretion pathway protein A